VVPLDREEPMIGHISRWITVVAVLAGSVGATPSRAAEAPLDDATLKSVLGALADERRNEAQYHRVLADLGSVRPFSNAVWAEGRHAAMLEDVLRTHGAAVPPAAPAGAPLASYATRKDACTAAVEGEKQNVALYDAAIVPGLPADVARVFEHNRTVSREHHLPAFERCAGLAASGADRGPGHGGWGHGRGRAGHGCGGSHCGCGGAGSGADAAAR
jgi:hypothetical protein